MTYFSSAGPNNCPYGYFDWLLKMLKHDDNVFIGYITTLLGYSRLGLVKFFNGCVYR